MEANGVKEVVCLAVVFKGKDVDEKPKLLYNFNEKQKYRQRIAE
jgi:hypothetical protein